MKMINIFLILLTLIVSLTGCSVFYGPQSPYSKYYDNMLENVRIPQSELIQQYGVIETYSKSPDEVWTALLKVVSQYEGIIGTGMESSGARKLIFIHGQEMQIKAPGGHKNPGMVMSKFLDTWTAVSVIPADGGRRTMVAAAFVSPQTGDLSPYSQFAIDEINEDSTIKKQNHVNTDKSNEQQNNAVNKANSAGSDSAQNGAAIFSSLDQIKKAEERWKYIPQSMISMFFYHLNTQLYGPDKWIAKFVDSQRKNMSTQKILKDIEHQEINDTNLKLENDIGNWTSAKFRRTLLIVDAPTVSKSLQDILEQLKKTAKNDDRKGQIYIVASPQINAFALPNGDIFVCSGLIDLLETRDEIAAVLGHELDHILQHDTANRLTSLSSAQNTATTLMIVGMVASVGVASAVAISSAASASSLSAAMAATSSTQTMLIQNLTTQSITGMSGSLGQSVGNSIIFGYSQETELRADQNGAKYVWGAGYNVEAELALLNKLSEAKTKAAKRSEDISSGLINCEPGLEKRTEEMKKVTESIKTFQDTN